MPKKVLLVEDDKLISNMYQVKLKQEGFDVIAAEDGGTALEMAKKELPDIVMLDVILPVLDGFSVLQEIKSNAKTKNIPVVMLTNLGTTEDKDKAKNFGASDYLVKASLTPATVCDAIKNILK